ncbi:Rho guanine nucleotide exchange factor 6 [Frankliniella fusca]|uniref:Rho guanine nucleotide exchange factor 6 n=1 Tax=Frankliniella fusca TaxID=407009 RepID=A0AAE1GT43_9NEOP|nr:Rho guanine nucleotide exchange factor 6 [Frankliniella fusca]
MTHLIVPCEHLALPSKMKYIAKLTVPQIPIQSVIIILSSFYLITFFIAVNYRLKLEKKKAAISSTSGFGFIQGLGEASKSQKTIITKSNLSSYNEAATKPNTINNDERATPQTNKTTIQNSNNNATTIISQERIVDTDCIHNDAATSIKDHQNKMQQRRSPLIISVEHKKLK